MSRRDDKCEWKLIEIENLFIVQTGLDLPFTFTKKVK